jgi:DNA polymerase-3 subunit alpha
LCKEFKPRSIEDLGIIVALNRPGPIRSGAPDSFIIRRNGGTDDKFDGRKIPILADITEPTYGWFLYQEQVIAFFTKLGYRPI